MNNYYESKPVMCYQASGEFRLCDRKSLDEDVTMKLELTFQPRSKCYRRTHRVQRSTWQGGQRAPGRAEQNVSGSGRGWVLQGLV